MSKRREDKSREAAVPVATARLAKQADGKVLLIDRSKCFFPEACPGCPNCDRFVPLPESG
jgi:hypothetical protein